jgi:serine/threonine protein kinase
MASLRHAAPAPLSALVEVRLSAAGRRVRRIASLTSATLELRVEETSPPAHRFGLIDARVESVPFKQGIVLRTVQSPTCPPAKIRLYFFSKIKHVAWLRALHEAARWKLETFYALASPMADDTLVGKGIFASVFKARDLLSQEQVAVKIVPKTTVNKHVPMHPKLDVFVRRESRISRIVHHECIVQIYDVFESPTALAIVMELYPYTLPDLLAVSGPLDEPTAAFVTMSLLRALNYLHELDIVHRDIKPENVLCSGTKLPFKVALCDFGLANFVDRRAAHIAAVNAKNGLAKTTVLGQVGSFELPRKAALDGFTFSSAIGTPAYIAPEVIGRERYGSPIDVWGVGIMLYYMLSGRVPFEGEDASAALEKVREGALRFGDCWTDVSGEAVALTRALLNRDQRKRIGVDAALIHPWILKPPVRARCIPAPSDPPSFTAELDPVSL